MHVRIREQQRRRLDLLVHRTRRPWVLCWSKQFGLKLPQALHRHGWWFITCVWCRWMTSISETRSICMVSKSVSHTSTSKLSVSSSLKFIYSKAIWVVTMPNLYIQQALTNSYFHWLTNTSSINLCKACMRSKHAFAWLTQLELNWEMALNGAAELPLLHCVHSLSINPMFCFLVRRSIWFYPVRALTRKIWMIRGKWNFLDSQLERT